MQRQHIGDAIDQRILAMMRDGHVLARSESVIAEAIATFIWPLVLFIVMEAPFATIVRQPAIGMLVRIRVKASDRAKLAVLAPSVEIDQAVGPNWSDEDITLAIIAIWLIRVARQSKNDLF